MSPSKRYAKKQAKTRQRRRLQGHERLERDKRQAQRAAEALSQSLEDLGQAVALTPPGSAAQAFLAQAAAALRP